MPPFILQAPMSALLAQLSLPGHVTNALTDRSSVHGPPPSLAEAVEAPCGARPDDTAASPGLSTTVVDRFHAEAIAWAEKLAP